MSESILQFVWIDDSPERAESASNLERTLAVNVKFIDVKDKSLPEVIFDLVNNSNEPDLIIIDHNLHDVDSGIFKKGSSVAPSIRESWPECPIICVSGDDISEVDSQQKMLYEDIFSIEEISEHYLKILSIAESYITIRKNRPIDSEGILSLLKAPEIDYYKLASVIPTHSYKDKSLAVDISRWVRKVLLSRPGFLYDKLWLSTLIGIQLSSFEKVAHYFEESKYKGIFANDEDERWWKSTSLDILYSISETGTLPWERGRGIEGIEEADYSRSYATGKFFPETVAYIDQSRNASQEPVLIKESELHPDFENLLYFDELRIMKAAE